MSTHHSDSQNNNARMACCGCSTDTHSISKEFRWQEHRALIASGILAFASELFSLFSHSSWWVPGLALVSILLGGRPTLRNGFRALKNLTLNINLLMTIAVIGAFLLGEFPEAAVVVFLFTVAELIEEYSLVRARKQIHSLLEAAPERAWVVTSGSQIEQQPSDKVPAGALIEVRPDERLPLDGVVETGSSVINQAPITGESVAVEKNVGDPVFAGSINGHGVLRIRTTAESGETTLARIVKIVEQAQSDKAPTQRFIDRFARIYTPFVVVLAFLLGFALPLVLHEPFLPWIYQALVLLVIACPCALVISTPVTIVSGLAAAARAGILVKGGSFLEQGKDLTLIALDKTGTITEGKPRVTDVVPLAEQSPADLLQLAASLDALSNHPVARAIADAWDGEKRAVENVVSITGRGLEGDIGGGRYFIGNHRLAEERGVCHAAIEAQLRTFEAQAKTAVVVGDPKQALGIVAVADAPRASSRDAIRAFHELGLKTVMLSGDNELTAQSIAKQVGVDEVRANLLPEEKLSIIRSLSEREKVGMVGDGVNDAPALAHAPIGFAMGAIGSDVAIETADVALMQDDLSGVATFILLSRKTYQILMQNIALAIGAKLLFFGLAAGGFATLWMAVVADIGVSLVVIANALRILNFHKKPL